MPSQKGYLSNYKGSESFIILFIYYEHQHLMHSGLWGNFHESDSTSAIVEGVDFGLKIKKTCVKQHGFFSIFITFSHLSPFNKAKKTVKMFIFHGNVSSIADKTSRQIDKVEWKRISP